MSQKFIFCIEMISVILWGILVSLLMYNSVSLDSVQITRLSIETVSFNTLLLTAGFMLLGIIWMQIILIKEEENTKLYNNRKIRVKDIRTQKERIAMQNLFDLSASIAVNLTPNMDVESFQVIVTEDKVDDVKLLSGEFDNLEDYVVKTVLPLSIKNKEDLN